MSSKKAKRIMEHVVTKNIHVDALKELGYWINSDKNTFENDWLTQKVKETSTKADGILNSEMELRKSIADLAKSSPENTVKIINKATSTKRDIKKRTKS